MPAAFPPCGGCPKGGDRLSHNTGFGIPQKLDGCRFDTDRDSVRRAVAGKTYAEKLTDADTA